MRLDVPRLIAPAATVVLAAILVLTAATGEIVLVGLAVLVVQLLVAAGPAATPDASRPVPGPRFVPVVVASLVATGIAIRPAVLVGRGDLVVSDLGRVSSGVLAGILPAVAAGLIVAVVGQVLRRGSRPRLVPSLGQASTLVIVAVLASGWVGAASALNGSTIVRLCAVSVAVAAIVWAAPLDPVICAVASVLLAGVAGGVSASGLQSGATPVLGVAVGATIAALVVLGQVLAIAWSGGQLSRAEAHGFAAAASVALAGPMAYLAAQIVTVPVLGVS